jgi:hypothetical protein
MRRKSRRGCPRMSRADLQVVAAADIQLEPAAIRVRVEIMGSHKCRIVGKYQSVAIMIDAIIFTRARSTVRCGRVYA